MSRSERLHNQGSEQQNITPELKLSMELWDTCERIIKEKGQNILFLFKIVRLEKDRKDEEISNPDSVIVWSGIFPRRSKLMRVHVRSMQQGEPDTTNLHLRKQRRGEIVDTYWRQSRQEKRLATMEELETYKRYINQSSPIEHK